MGEVCVVFVWCLVLGIVCVGVVDWCFGVDYVLVLFY